jgi:hypothetical protein
LSTSTLAAGVPDNIVRHIIIAECQDAKVGDALVSYHEARVSCHSTPRMARASCTTCGSSSPPCCGTRRMGPLPCCGTRRMGPLPCCGTRSMDPLPCSKLHHLASRPQGPCICQFKSPVPVHLLVKEPVPSQVSVPTPCLRVFKWLHLSCFR